MKKKQALHPLTVRCEEELKVALKSFGTYQFDDKGPGEVMNIDAISREFRDLTPAVAAQVIDELSSESSEIEHQGRLQSVAEYLISMNDDWDELFEFEVVQNLY